MVAILLAGSRDTPNIRGEALLFNEGRLADTLRSIDVPVHVIPENGRSFGLLVLEVRRWLRGKAIDVVHAHRYKEILLTVLARRPRQAGLIVTVHGLQPRVQLTANDFLLNWTAFLAARLTGARFVAVSKELTERLAARIGRQCVVHIPNPVPPLPAVEGQPDLHSILEWDPRRRIVGFVGRLEHVKGPDVFIDLAARCRGNVGFVLIGSGALKGHLAARVAAEGLVDRVAFLGEVPDATAYLRQLDLLVLSSRDEGLPLILLEAAACQVPVVAFNVGGVSEVLDGSRAARLVAPGDIGGLQRAVSDLLEDREEIEGEAAKWAGSVRARFTVTRTLAAYAALYEVAAGQASLKNAQ